MSNGSQKVALERRLRKQKALLEKQQEAARLAGSGSSGLEGVGATRPALLLGGIQPLPCDRWVAMSALQKAIRRGQVETAKRAVRTLLVTGKVEAVWKRLLIIGFEDIGLGSLDALLMVCALASEKAIRAEYESELAALDAVVIELCQAPKDRSADLLYSIAKFDPALSGFRSMLDGKSDAERLGLLAQRSLSLYERAALVLHIVNARGKVTAGTVTEVLASLGGVAPEGVRSGSATSGSSVTHDKLSGHKLTGHKRTGDKLTPGRDSEPKVTGAIVDDLLRCFAGLGVSDTLLAMIKVSAYKAQEPMCLMMMPLWLDQRIRIDRPSSKPSTYPASKPAWQLEHGVPVAALDGFTRLGRKAISIFAADTEAVRACVEALPKQHVAAAMRLAVFYADSAVTYPALNWQHQREVQTRGIAADFAGFNITSTQAMTLVDTVRTNLNHLNAIRRNLLVGLRAGTPTGMDTPET